MSADKKNLIKQIENALYLAEHTRDYNPSNVNIVLEGDATIDDLEDYINTLHNFLEELAD